jgi:glyceraldehyde-3-phosphate dehydrogenase/erythrose-4-phosphate dehydrogenase
MRRIVHVVGTGTIGEPLIGLLADHRTELGLDEVTFHKRTPRPNERPKLESLMRRGARVAVDAEARPAFERLGLRPAYDAREALERATVVIDCTPAGNANKPRYTSLSGPIGFIAQGSEFGFGKMYARGINDAALCHGEDRFLQVVSCNTHNLAVLIKTLAGRPDGSLALNMGRFVCMRRANDLSQETDFVSAPQVSEHDDPQFGTHQARDAYYLFQTLGCDLDIYSSAMKLPTQYMHTIWFELMLRDAMSREEALRRLVDNPRVALTGKTSAALVFSFGRDHGYYGRILSQTVVSVPSLTVRGRHEVLGFCFTPQDGNAILSSVAASLWFIDPETYEQRLKVLRPYLFQEV